MYLPNEFAALCGFGGPAFCTKYCTLVFLEVEGHFSTFNVNLHEKCLISTDKD
jgi:hypothetical protein